MIDGTTSILAWTTREFTPVTNQSIALDPTHYR